MHRFDEVLSILCFLALTSNCPLRQQARPIDQLREGLLKTTMRVDVRNFLKGSPLPTVPGSTTVSRRQSLDGSDNDECAIDDSTTFDEAAIQRQEESMQRRQAFVQRQIAEENKDFQKQVGSTA
jgi:hypothetical protein